MNAITYFLAVYGLVVVWRENYLAYLRKPAENDKPPFMDQFMFLMQWFTFVDDGTWRHKPWSCPLCMSYLIGVLLLPLFIWIPVTLLPFGAIGVTHLLVEIVRYVNLDPGG